MTVPKLMPRQVFLRVLRQFTLYAAEDRSAEGTRWARQLATTLEKRAAQIRMVHGGYRLLGTRSKRNGPDAS